MSFLENTSVKSQMMQANDLELVICPEIRNSLGGSDIVKKV